MANSRILVIGDTHFPAQHQDTFDFLTEAKQRYKPDRIVHGGDEVDLHALSYHEKDPDLPSAGAEGTAGEELLHRLEKLFPQLDILDSNHGSLAARKAFTAGIPKRFLKSAREVWNVGPRWKWHDELTIRMSDGNFVVMHHSRGDGLAWSKNISASTVQAHHHSRLGVQYWDSPAGPRWAAQTGCLVNRKALQMAYNKNNIERCILGSLVILDGVPLPVPLLTDRHGRWVGKLLEP